jgi:hypothetical protein
MRFAKLGLLMVAICLSLPSRGQDKKESYWMVKPSFLYGDDLTCGHIQVPQLIIARRNFKSVSVNPALCLGRMLYADCEGGESKAFAIEAGIITNTQFYHYLHLRNQLYFGFQNSDHYRAWDDLWVGEATLGVGITGWRIEGSLDIGAAKYHGHGYPVIKLGLGYIFSKSNSVRPQ